MSRPTLRSHSLFLVLAALFLAGCAGGKLTSGGAAIVSNLERFRDFHLEGVVELHAGRLVLRKDIVVDEHAGVLQADVIEGGLLGLSPTPLFHFRADSTITLRTSLPIDLDASGANDWRDLPARVKREIVAHADSIAVSREFAIDGVVFHFDDQYRIWEATFSNAQLTIAYRNDEFHTFQLTRDRKSLAVIRVDRVSRGTL
jgi:hypothetical protein